MSDEDKPESPPVQHLALVPEGAHEQAKAKAVEDLDLEMLRDSMVKGIYQLEAALFTQSGFEYKRIEQLRNTISDFEKTLHDPNYVKNLSAKDKIRLYGLMLQNMNQSLGFLQTLHGNITSGVEALTHIEKLKGQRGQVQAPGELNDQKLAQVKALIMEKIKEKSQK